MMHRVCSLCRRSMHPNGLGAFFCRFCDRRICAACGAAEQDVSAAKCSACGHEYGTRP